MTANTQSAVGHCSLLINEVHHLQQIQRAIDLLGGIRSVSTSDAQRLIGTFGSIAAVANADIERLSLCPGLGPVKAENIFVFFTTPFVKS